LRRTYQFETSSTTKSITSRAAAVASYAASRSSASRSTVARRESTHRSTAGRLAGAGSAALGDQPKFAYCAKIPLYTFLSVRKKRPAISRMAPSSKRRGTHTWLDAIRKRRTASAP
jgi:hypothetical protein